MTTPAPKLQLTDDEWRKKLTPDEFARPAPRRHRAAVHRRVHRHQDRGRLRVPGLRRRTVPQQREIRIPLRLAVLLRSGQLRRGHPAVRRLAGHAPRRGDVRQLPQPPRPRLRGRGLPDAHRPALLHQLDLAAAGAEPALIDVEANERDVLATTWLGMTISAGITDAASHASNVTPIGVTFVSGSCALRGRRHQADGRAELANERTGRAARLLRQLPNSWTTVTAIGMNSGDSTIRKIMIGKSMDFSHSPRSGSSVLLSRENSSLSSWARIYERSRSQRCRGATNF